MKWIPALLLFLLAACQQEEKKQVQKEVEIPAEAEALYKAVNQHPDSISPRVQLVNALDSAGALSFALAQMDSLIKRDSANFGIWFHKAQLSEKAMDTAMALQSYQMAVRIYPSPDALLSMANLLAEKKNRQAIAICDEVESLRLGREYLAHASFIKGVYFARTGDLVKAMASFDRCIGNDYQYMEAYMEKGFLLYDTKQTDKAISIFEKALEIRPTYADASYWLAKCFETKGEKDKAILQYQKALVLDPGIKEANEALKRLGD
ncbi:tetratricopeptide repeat protein [Sediminibacterium sp.]|uniref:tetratricopeptide repeat protein n=1 Tax=Sediminibacterium sp. TaxID=1917865 RepID=UPI0025F76753|nr:tetratricopeptide repeat protein [Sediminibacterium sp.]MBW0177951.1 tetratricopeptide repeat protein [Sediminibacterium sp.]